MNPAHSAPHLIALLCMAILLVAFNQPVSAQPASARDRALEQAYYVADIELETTAEFGELLQRASELLDQGAVAQDGVATVSFILHGPVVKDLLRQNYLQNKGLVDLAASLSALQVVEIKACQTWMGGHGVNEQDLQPFVETVAYAPGEVQRLQTEKHYIQF